MIRSIRAHLYERTSSPLTGSFLLSWLAWNYRFILLLISGTPINDKYLIIDTVLYATWQQIYLQGLLFPIITAILYIFIYPYPAKFVFKFSRKRQKEIVDAKKEIEGETLLTISESRAIRAEAYKIEEELQNTITRKDSEIQRLKSEIDEFKAINLTKNSKSKKISPKASKPISTKEDITDSQIKVLTIIGESPNYIGETSLLNSYGKDHVKLKYDLQELENNNYISKSMGSGDYLFTLTHKGRKYLLDNGIA